MSKDRNNSKGNMKKLGRLINLYAQSRSALLLIPVLILLVIHAALICALIEFTKWCAYAGTPGWLILLTVIVFILISFGIWIWIGRKGFPRLEERLYRTEGEVVLEREKVPFWAWTAYAVTFVGPAFLETSGFMDVRWALTISLTSFGSFLFYVAKKHKEIILGVVFGGLCLFAAALTGFGMPILFGGEHAYFLTLITYIAAAGVCTAILVYVYNRAVLRRIKGASSFGRQPENSADPEH